MSTADDRRNAALPSARTRDVRLSVVVPVRDEEVNLEPLYERIAAALGPGPGWELLLVDDASRDASWKRVQGLAERDPRVRGLRFARHAGQSSAIFAGADAARGALVATLDADLQNDPAEIPRLVAALEGWDAVIGYRQERKDTTLRRVASRIANRIRDAVSGDHVTDTGCSLKVFAANDLRALPRFEGMHRFLPTLLRYRGLRVREIAVSHHRRQAGESKYGILDRAWRGLIDLLAVRWMRSRLIRSVVVETAERDDP